MEHILEHRKKITEQLVKSYSGEESTTGAPKFIIIGHSEPGIVALTAILNSLEKSQSGEKLNIFIDNDIDESKHQTPSAIDSIVLKGFSVEQLLIIKEDTQGKLEKSYIPELIDLIKAEDSVIEEKYKKKIAALKERRDPEGIEKAKEKAEDHDEEEGDAPEMEDNVEKSEGSRGGKVIGHTKSGKPVYAGLNARHNHYKDFSVKDHSDAYEIHYNKRKDYVLHAMNKIEAHTGLVGKYKKEGIPINPHFNIGTRGNRDFIQTDSYHYDDKHNLEQKLKDLKKDAPQKWDEIADALDEKDNNEKAKESHGFQYRKKSNIRKSEELTPGEIERQRVADNLQKAYTPIFEDPDYLEKGKKAEIGEIRTWGGVKYVKHQDGWVTFNQKTGKGSVYGSDGKKKMDATLNHIGHYSEHTDTKGGGHVVLPDSTIKVNKPKEDSKTLVERYREIKNNHDNDPKQISHNDILDSMRRTHSASKNQVEEALVEYGESKIGFTSKAKETTKKPTLEEVDTAFSKVGKALAEGRDPDAITSLRDEAKKLGAAYGMSNEKIDEAISTSKKAHQGEHSQLTEAEKRDSLIENINSILSDKEIDVEDFLKKLNTTSENLSKEKSKILDNKILFKKQLLTSFSGSWGVPNLTTNTTYHFSENMNDEDKIKSFIKDEKVKEKEHLKKQKKQQENHDYRYQRPSTSQTEYGITTLRKVLKDFEKRQKSSHGTMSSSRYNYMIKNDNSFKIG